MPRLILGLIFVVASLLSACGLTPKDQAVANANDAISAVEEAGQQVADAINQLPEEQVDAAAFSPLSQSLRTYIERAEQLNAALRGLGSFFPSLGTYIDETFRPAAESALQACQEALDSFSSEASSQEDYRRAVTRVGLCLQRFATAVSNVSAEYGRIPD
jgi:hypothetical protein